VEILGLLEVFGAADGECQLLLLIGVVGSVPLTIYVLEVVLGMACADTRQCSDLLELVSPNRFLASH